ncbi:MAG: dTDP-4-dehydrorhamnose 3,5-epimerase [Hyphomicrobiales bacterium]|nr:dTDP-4-dehydrorhamnose 3,5-epimerase [Hyphomicrobiales bacterium]
MQVSKTSLPGVVLVDMDVFPDERGYFFESYHFERYAAAGIASAFVQDNVSFSKKGVLRGLHLQHPHAQIKLISVLEGEIFDVAVDVRVGSPHFGQWTSTLLTADNHQQLLVPEGYAHGFYVLSATALVTYKVSERHEPVSALAVAWNDPDIGITWPAGEPTLSAKDAAAPLLRDIPPDRLPRYQGQTTS